LVLNTQIWMSVVLNYGHLIGNFYTNKLGGLTTWFYPGILCQKATADRSKHSLTFKITQKNVKVPTWWGVCILFLQWLSPVCMAVGIWFATTASITDVSHVEAVGFSWPWKGMLFSIANSTRKYQPFITTLLQVEK